MFGGVVSAVTCWTVLLFPGGCFDRGWSLYYDWALASHVAEYDSIVYMSICNIYLRYNNNIGTSM